MCTMWYSCSNDNLFGTRPRWTTMRPWATFSFFQSPLRSFLLVALTSSSLIPPHPSFLLVPPHLSFFLVQHCLNHLESTKVHFSSILIKAFLTNGRKGLLWWEDAHAKLHITVSKNYLNHLESGKFCYSPSLPKAIQTDAPTNGPAGGQC